MKELLEAGVHFGHQTRRWNPKMKEYIFGERNGIHIIDLQKTLKMFREASRFVGELTAQGRNVLFVGTKRQAQEAVAEEAKRCGGDCGEVSAAHGGSGGFGRGYELRPGCGGLDYSRERRRSSCNPLVHD